MTGRAARASGRTEAGLAHKLGLLVVVLVLAAGMLVYVVLAPTPDPGGATPPQLGEPPASGPGLALAEPPPPAEVLPAATGQPPTVAGLRRLVEPALGDKSLGPHVAFAVRDLASPAVHWSSGAPVVTPASTLKLLTSATALATMGPEHRFSTSVTNGAGRREIVLVGGGDPLLTDVRPADPTDSYPARATLATLARRTAARLEQQGRHSVRLSYFTGLFDGPAVNPHWEPDYVPDDVVSPIVSLWVDEGREVAGFAARSPDPALVAAQRFADQLDRAGIRVLGDIRQATPPDGTTVLASVESAPLVEIVQHTLEVSDNEAAEVLLRQSALAAGRPGSFAAGAATVRATLRGLGVDLAGARIFDGSGLSRDNRLGVGALIDVLAAAAEDPRLAAVLTTLPVAGFNGSLGYRFVDVAPDGLGYVRAKTGTLTGVHGLAGLVMTADQRPLLFAVVADRVPVPRTLDARAQLDRIAALLATCGC